MNYFRWVKQYPLVLFVICYAIWVLSHFFALPLFTIVFPKTAFFYVTPLFIFSLLAITIYFTMKNERKNSLLLLLVLSNVILLGFPLRTIFDIRNWHGEGALGASLIVGGFATFDLFVSLVEFFVLLFLFVHVRFTRGRSSRSATYAISLLGILASIFFGRQALQMYFFQKSFCTQTPSGGFYNELYFLKPITNDDVAELLQKSGLTANSLLLAPIELGDEGFIASFIPPMTARSARESIEPQLPALWRRHPDLISTTSTKLAIKKYEEGEAVVRIVDIDSSAPMLDVIRLAKELDDQHLLGNYVLPDGSRTSYYPTNPSSIKPQTPEARLWQAECYRFLKK